MTESQITLIIGIGGSLLAAGFGFFLNTAYTNYLERKKTRKDNLKTHFQDIYQRIIPKISEMARGFQERNNRLVFGGVAPVQEKYNFEEEEEYKGFEMHFPELAEEWKQLLNNALRMNEELKNAKAIDIVPLQRDFENYAKRLTNTANRVERYGIGTEFKHNKDCPICKTF